MKRARTIASTPLSIAPGLAAGLVALLALGPLPACGGGPTRDEVTQSQREYDLGVGLWQEHNMAGSFEHLLGAIRLDPDNAEAHLLLGNLYMIHRHDYEQAEHHFREAMRANVAAPVRAGMEADAKNSLGVLYIHAERYPDAVSILRESASDIMNREPAVAWTNLGWAYLEQHQLREAFDALQQAVQLSPQLCMAWYRMAQVRTAQEDWAQAEESLTRGLEVEDPTCQSLQAAWRLRGEVRARLGHREEAIADLERCVELSSDTEDGQGCRRLLESTGQ